MNVCIVLRRKCWEHVRDWVCLCNKGAIMWDWDTKIFIEVHDFFSTVFGFIQLENILSHGTEDAGVHKIVLASLKRLG